jgi:hypothetical protein
MRMVKLAPVPDSLVACSLANFNLQFLAIKGMAPREYQGLFISQRVEN